MTERESRESIKRERDELRRENAELKRRLQERIRPAARPRRFPGGGRVYYLNTSKGI